MKDYFTSIFPTNMSLRSDNSNMAFLFPAYNHETISISKVVISDISHYDGYACKDFWIELDHALQHAEYFQSYGFTK